MIFSDEFYIYLHRKSNIKNDIICWLYENHEKIISDYTLNFALNKTNLVNQVNKTIKNVITNDLCLFKKEIIDEVKKTIQALGKYKFDFKCNESKLILKDPENPLENISPRKQGVIDCIYSFEDSLFNYKDKNIVINVIENTIAVLTQLSKFINLYTIELEEQLNKFCVCSLKK